MNAGLRPARALAALAVCLLLVVAVGCASGGTANQQRGPVSSSDGTATGELRSLEGETLAVFEAKVEALGYRSVRVRVRDGVWQSVTADLDPKRVNVEVLDDRVVRVIGVG